MPALILGTLAVCLIVFIVHVPALTAGAISFDDNQYLTENPLVLKPSWNGAWRFLAEVLEPSTVRGYYQPLAMLSLMIDSALGGGPDNLMPFHRTSLVLHVVNVALVVALLYLLFDSVWAALAVGLLFGVHPMTVEPIPWVGERKTLLTTLFALASLVCYVRSRRGGGAPLFVASMLLYALALLSKPTSTPLPVVMLLMDVWPLGRFGWRAVIEKVPFFVIGGVSAVVTYVSQARTAAVAEPDFSAAVIPLTLCHNVVFYLSKVVWPANLSPHYPYPMPFGLGQPAVVAGVVGTVVLAALLVMSLRWTRAPAVGWLIFFVAIFPTMGVVGFTHSIASDKYAYLPAAGLLMVAAWGLIGVRRWLARRMSTLAAWAVVAAAVVPLAVDWSLASRDQHAIWRDTETHFRYMLSLAPASRTLRFGLGDALRRRAMDPREDFVPNDRRQMLDEALEHYLGALRPGPDSPFGRNDVLTCSAHNNIGNMMAQRGRIDAAIRHWSAVLALDPNSFNAHNNLGIALSWQGKSREAIEHYRRALSLCDDLPEAHTNLGVELAKVGEVEAAIGHLRRALELRPSYPLAERHLKAILQAKGQGPSDANGTKPR